MKVVVGATSKPFLVFIEEIFWSVPTLLILDCWDDKNE